MSKLVFLALLGMVVVAAAVDAEVQKKVGHRTADTASGALAPPVEAGKHAKPSSHPSTSHAWAAGASRQRAVGSIMAHWVLLCT